MTVGNELTTSYFMANSEKLPVYGPNEDSRSDPTLPSPRREMGQAMAAHQDSAEPLSDGYLELIVG